MREHPRDQIPLSERRVSIKPGLRKERTQDASSRAELTRFGILFISLVILFSYLSSTRIAARFLHDPLCGLVARSAVPFLSLWGDASSAGSLLNLDGFSVSIVEACDGVLPAYIYLCAILAFPSRWSAKLWGVLLGIPAILLINLFRVVTLAIVGARWPDLFEGVHIYVWQALVIALSMALWILWAERFARTASRVRA
jgi:exosortase H (IPTLxxWG-CTERM-specific)